MTLPPQPSVPGGPAAPTMPNPASRTCSACGGAMTPLGIRPIRTTSGPGLPDGVMPLAMCWCPNCSKVEFYSNP